MYRKTTSVRKEEKWKKQTSGGEIFILQGEGESPCKCQQASRNKIHNLGAISKTNTGAKKTDLGEETLDGGARDDDATQRQGTKENIKHI